MTRKLLLAFSTLSLTLSLAAGERLLPVAGSVGAFRTDVRVFNPSRTSAITVDAYLLSLANSDNRGRFPVSFVVNPREQKAFDDVISSLFGGSGIAAIRFVSGDPFSVTARIYAEDVAGTKGQFAVAPSPDSIALRGAVLQLESTDAFRSNIGMLNASEEPATIVLRLHAKDGSDVGSISFVLRPLGGIGPTSVATLIPGAAGSDLSDAWVSYESDRPVVVYGSVIDNATTDPAWVAAVDDPVEPGLPPSAREYAIRGAGSRMTVDGSVFGVMTVRAGERVRIRLTAADHGIGIGYGFLLTPFLQFSPQLLPGEETVVEFVPRVPGEYPFFCASACGGYEGPVQSGKLVVTQ